MGDEREHQTAYFPYILCCDVMRTPIHNQSKKWSLLRSGFCVVINCNGLVPGRNPTTNLTKNFVQLLTLSQAVFEWTRWCSPRLYLSEIEGVLGRGRSRGKHNGYRDSGHWLTCNCGNVEDWVKQHPPRDETGWEQEPVDHGMMLYLVCFVLSVNWWLEWHREIEGNDVTLCS